MNKPRLNPQIIAIFFVITAIFIGSGLFFFSLTKDMLRNSVEAETKTTSDRISGAIDAIFSEDGIMSGTYGVLTMQDIFNNDESTGKDIDIWLISEEGRIYIFNGHTQLGNLFTDASLVELGVILSDEKYRKEGYTGWIGDNELILLHKNCCIIKPVFDGSMYTVTLNYCNDIKAMQRRQFALFMLVILILLAITIVMITNIIFNYRRQIIRLATIDELTGLMNRKSFHNEYSEFIISRHSEAFTLFLLDIDYFKQINDNYGHAAGDDALRILAQHIMDMTDKYGGFAGRWGGDEFIGVLKVSGSEAAEALNTLCREIKADDRSGNFCITISAGAAEADDDPTLVSLSEKADLALYESKENGRDRFTLHKTDKSLSGTETESESDRQVLPLHSKSESETHISTAQQSVDTPPQSEDDNNLKSSTETAIPGGASAAQTASGGFSGANGSTFRERLSAYIHYKLIESTILGVHWMAPFIAGGGILIALAFLFDAASVDLSLLALEERAGFGSITPLASTLKNIGGITFNFMLPVFAGFMAYSLAGEDAFLAGFVGGYMTIETNSGFVGAMIAGLIAGVVSGEIQRFTNRLPSLMRKIAPILIYPIFCLILMQAVSWLIIRPISSAVGELFTAVLDAVVSSNRVLGGGFSAMMMATDMGGIINKVAYNYGVNGLASDSTDIMASVMIGGMVPPIGIFLSMVLFRNRFTSAEWERGPGALCMGLAFITEGALPYVFTDFLRVIPCCMAGSAVAGTLSVLFGCTLPAPHGGIFVFPVMTHRILYVIALVIGSSITAVLLGLLKKPRTDSITAASS